MQILTFPATGKAAEMISLHLTWLLGVPRSKAQPNKAVINFTPASFLHSERQSASSIDFFFLYHVCRDLFFIKHFFFGFIKVPEFSFSSIRLYFFPNDVQKSANHNWPQFLRTCQHFLGGMWSSRLESLPHVSDWNWREYVPAPMPYLNIQWAWEAGDKFALDAGTMIHQSNFSAPSSHVLRVIRWMARPAVSGSTVSRFLKKLNLWHQDIPRAIGAL